MNHPQPRLVDHLVDIRHPGLAAGQQGEVVLQVVESLPCPGLVQVGAVSQVVHRDQTLQVRHEQREVALGETLRDLGGGDGVGRVADAALRVLMVNPGLSVSVDLYLEYVAKYNYILL